MKRRSSVPIALAATVLLTIAGVVFLAFDSAGEVEYYVHVDQLVADPAPWLARTTIQVHGFARRVPEKGTMDTAKQTITRRFELENKGKVIQISHEGVVPDTFKEEAETVVKGTLTKLPDGTFLLTTVGGETGIMAKCPSKYQGKS